MMQKAVFITAAYCHNRIYNTWQTSIQSHFYQLNIKRISHMAANIVTSSWTLLGFNFNLISWEMPLAISKYLNPQSHIQLFFPHVK